MGDPSGDLGGKLWVRGVVERCGKGGVVLFEKEGEFLVGLCRWCDSGWSFEESERLVRVSIFKEVGYAGNVLFVPLALLSQEFLWCERACVFAGWSSVAGVLFF